MRVETVLRRYEDGLGLDLPFSREGEDRDAIDWLDEIETKVGEKVKSDVRVTAVLRWNAEARRWLVVQWHVSSGLKERLPEY